MTWQLSLAGLLVGILVGHDRHGRRLADDADPDPGLRLRREGRGRDGHPPRRDLQVVRRRATPDARHRARAARALDARSARRRCRSSACRSRAASATTPTRRWAGSSAARSSSAGSASSRRRSCTDTPTTRRSSCARATGSSAIVIGAACGFVVGLTSVGSGTFFGLAMLLLFPLTAQKIVGTDILHAAALLWVAGVGHLLHGNVDLHAMGWLLVGSIPGVLLGSQMSIRVPERSLRFAFAFILVLSGIKLVGVPQASLIIVIALGVAASSAAGALVVRQRLSRRPVARRRTARAARLHRTTLAASCARTYSTALVLVLLGGHDRRVRRHRASEARAEPDHEGLARRRCSHRRASATRTSRVIRFTLRKADRMTVVDRRRDRRARPDAHRPGRAAARAASRRRGTGATRTAPSSRTARTERASISATGRSACRTGSTSTRRRRSSSCATSGRASSSRAAGSRCATC